MEKLIEFLKAGFDKEPGLTSCLAVIQDPETLLLLLFVADLDEEGARAMMQRVMTAPGVPVVTVHLNINIWQSEALRILKQGKRLSLYLSTVPSSQLA